MMYIAMYIVFCFLFIVGLCLAVIVCEKIDQRADDTQLLLEDILKQLKEKS